MKKLVETARANHIEAIAIWSIQNQEHKMDEEQLLVREAILNEWKIIGLLLLLNPHGVWKATERWNLLGAAEASPAFHTIARVLGTVLLVIGILVCFGILV